VIGASPSAGPEPTQVGDLAVVETDLEATSTDAFVVIRNGTVAAKWAAADVDLNRPHLLFSVTKSVAGLLAGVLVERGDLDVDAAVVKYLPDFAGSAYEDATVRDLLDMTVSVDFEEAYLDPVSAYGRYRRAMEWNPPLAGEIPVGLRAVLREIQKGGEPHGRKHAYRSPNTDVLGILLEEVSGMTLSGLIETVLWRPIGARSLATMTVDRYGTPRAAGGLSATVRDLARIGELVLNDGRLGEAQLIPASWIRDLWAGGSHEVWTAGDQPSILPHGNYRSCWYNSGNGELAAIGIHGQWLWVDRTTNTVIAKVSSQELPVDDDIDLQTIALFRRLSRGA
jgi:CubicO group peptidase (beta-lactamase class C family)